MNNIYYTHDNGGRPFKVVIDPKIRMINVFKNSDPKNYETYDLNIYTNTYEKIFIGKSEENKMTLFSGGIGESFDGNSILCLLANRKYLYIGERIFTFDIIGSDQNKIIKYISDVGNNDVPYPYAIDAENNIYFLIESIVLVPNNSNMIFMNESFVNNDSPYTGLYNLTKLTKINKNKPNLLNINKFYIGNDVYNLTYNPDPAQEYDRLLNVFNEKLSYKTTDFDKIDLSDRIELTKDKYIELMNSYGNLMGLAHINNLNLIVERDF